MTGRRWEAAAAIVLDSADARAAAAVVRCRGPSQTADRLADQLDAYATALHKATNPDPDQSERTNP